MVMTNQNMTRCTNAFKSLGKFKSHSWLDTTIYILEWLKFKKLTEHNVEEDLELQDLS